MYIISHFDIWINYLKMGSVKLVSGVHNEFAGWNNIANMTKRQTKCSNCFFSFSSMIKRIGIFGTMTKIIWTLLESFEKEILRIVLFTWFQIQFLFVWLFLFSSWSATTFHTCRINFRVIRRMNLKPAIFIFSSIIRCKCLQSTNLLYAV